MAKILNLGKKKESKRKKVDAIHALFHQANNTNRQLWEFRTGESENFYNDEQLTAEEEKELKAHNIPTFTINRITPVVETMKYFLTAQRPRFRTIGRDDSGIDSKISAIHTALMDYSWDLSSGNLVYNQVIHDSIVKQCGYFHLSVDKEADRGLGEVKIGFARPEEVFVDPASVDRLYRDAGFIMIAKNLSKTYLKQELPQYHAIIDSATGGNIIGMTASKPNLTKQDLVESYFIKPSTGETEEPVSYFEKYSKIRVPYITFLQKIPPDAEEIAMMKKQSEIQIKEVQREIAVKIKELQVKFSAMVQAKEMLPERAELELDKAKKKHAQYLQQLKDKISSSIKREITKTVERDISLEAFKKLSKNKEIAKTIVPNSENEYYATKILVECVVGDKLLYSSILDRSQYPIIPVPFNHTGNPYPLGLVKYLIGKQREINKSHQIMIHHANLSSNPATYIKEGSIIDEDEWDDNSSMPGGKLKWTGDTPPTPKVPMPLNNAFYTITREGATDMDYMAGIWARAMGAGVETNEPFKTTLAMDEFSTRRLKTFLFYSIEPALKQVALVYTEIAQKTFTGHKVFRVTNPRAGMNNEQEQIEYEINKPITNNFGELIGKYFDYQSAKFDVEVVSGSVFPANEALIEKKFFEYFKAGVVDQIAMLKKIDVEDKEGIEHRTSIIRQLKQQIEQMETQMKDVQGENDTMRRQIIQSGIALDTIKGTVINKEASLQTQAEQKNLRNKMKTDYQLELGKLKNEIEKIKNTLVNNKKGE